jgi:hypothetical protein
MGPTMTSKKYDVADSPESRIEPTEDMNTVQRRITGESLPEVILELCDACHWSLICFNRRGITETCPSCGIMGVSKIPMNIDEVCKIEFDETRGVTIRFDRKRPLR